MGAGEQSAYSGHFESVCHSPSSTVLDRAPLSPDRSAYRAAGVASDVMERTASLGESWVTRAGVSPRWAVSDLHACRTGAIRGVRAASSRCHRRRVGWGVQRLSHQHLSYSTAPDTRPFYS